MLDDLDTLMEKYEIDALVATGSAFDSPNILWLTGFRSPDPIIYLKNRGEEGLVATAFHALQRVKSESFIKKTFDLTEEYIGILKENKSMADNMERFYKPLLKHEFSGEVLGVPDDFPASQLVLLQQMGYDVKVVKDLLPRARATKTSKELSIIQKAGDATTSAISEIVSMIKDSDIGANHTLIYDGEELTVGKVKNRLEHALLDCGAESAEDAIVAVGKKGFDWHYLGDPDDKVKSGVPIIMDVFPRLKRERYVADVTRTVVKGQGDARLRDMFEAVIAAAGKVIDALTDGAIIDDVNMACFNTLKEHGFGSLRLNPVAVEGMTHGLGHGIGLEVHEEPSLYRREERFAAGNVMAIEPGVYLKDVGGVRIENDYSVSKGKARLLTTGLDEMLFV
ncbi:MAG: M24 family metallopeptidase [Candidatus Thorarchaeota archaeon]|nr:MAG: hypothetical protein DRP09_03045 [Candidatus Thorarchaeota archaeon]RLI59834.1 MAG: hypothetical protein DRO87_01755 [Candidatus Thorarchaeota archaeon]